MAGLDPAIHGFARLTRKDVDARIKSGHDDSLCDHTWLARSLSIKVRI
jgi:hypothetical protein